MKNSSIALLAVITLAAVPTVTQAESKGAEAARLRWDIAAGISVVSGGEVGLASNVTLAYDNAGRRISYRYIEYSDRSIFGGKGICPLGCGHQDLLDTTNYFMAGCIPRAWRGFRCKAGSDIRVPMGISAS